MTTTELNTLLKQKKIVTDSSLKTLQQDWQTVRATTPWEDFLMEKELVTEAKLLELKSEQLGVPSIDLRNEPIPADVLNLVPEPIAHRHKIISFAKTKDHVSLAMMDPTDIQTKEFIKKKTGLEIKVFLIGKTSLEFGLSKYHSNLEGEIKHLVAEGDQAPAEGAAAGGELKKMAEEIPVIRVVDTLLEYAVIEKASDIHIEPQENFGNCPLPH